jgi:hypothetical protein
MFPARTSSPRILLSRLALLLPALLVAMAWSADADPFAYPTGYRQWTLAKFKFIGPESPQWDNQGGLRHHFANDLAIGSWGKFRDGSVIVDERVHTRLDAQKVWQGLGNAHVAVMRKDTARCADTGGWCFNVFIDDDTTAGMSRGQAKARCFDACHKTQQARDFVFSDPRR